METELIFELRCTDIQNVQITIDNAEIDLALWKKREKDKWEMEYSIMRKRNIDVIITIYAEQNETATLQIWGKEKKQSIGIYSLNVKKDETAETKLSIPINQIKDCPISRNDVPQAPPPIPYPSKTGPSSSLRQTRSMNKNSLGRPAKKEDNFEVPVFFATDRNTYLEKNKVRFGVERGDIQYGTVVVNIPQNKIMGEVPRPNWWKLEFRENPDKHVMILDQEIMDKDFFFTSIRQTIAAADENDAFIFVHGYNVSFDEAAMRTAQIAHDVKFGGAPILYSWPSRASVEGYFSDEDNVAYSHKHMLQFLKDVREKTDAKKLHLIAHSMGNRALTKALVELKEENYFKDFQFTQIILAAPDIDAQIFIEDIAPMLSNTSSGQVTLYVSSKDKALELSRSFRKHLRRAGDGGADIVCVKGIETIDASHVDTSWLGHGYFAETKSLLDDINSILQKNETPQERKLKPFRKGDFNYWAFKADN